MESKVLYANLYFRQCLVTLEVQIGWSALYRYDIVFLEFFADNMGSRTRNLFLCVI